MTDATQDPKPRLSKALRYEILRRDNHTCRYCGGTAPDVKLTVDHVMPVALGGPTTPDNLAAACSDCNAGKKATPPGAPLVEDVKQSNLRWATAIRYMADLARQQYEAQAALIWDVDNEWIGCAALYRDGHTIPRPDDWESSVETWLELGMTGADLDYAIRRAMRNQRIVRSEVWRYTAGIIWKMLTERQDAARAMLDAEDADNGT